MLQSALVQYYNDHGKEATLELLIRYGDQLNEDHDLIGPKRKDVPTKENENNKEMKEEIFIPTELQHLIYKFVPYKDLVLKRLIHKNNFKEVFKVKFETMNIFQYINQCLMDDEVFFIPLDMYMGILPHIPMNSHRLLYVDKELIDKHCTQLCWYALSANPCLNEDIILHFRNSWIMDSLSTNPCLTMSILGEFVPEELEWNNLSKNPCITDEMIKEYQDFFKWDTLSENKHLTLSTIKEYKDMWNWDLLCANPALLRETVSVSNTNIFERITTNKQQFSKDTKQMFQAIQELIEMVGDEWNWYAFSQNPMLNFEIIEYFKTNIQFSALAAYGPITELIINTYKERWNWNLLSANPNLTETIIDQHIDKWRWDNVSKHMRFNENMIEKYINKIVWKSLSRNDNLTESIIMKYENKDWSWDNITETVYFTEEGLRRYVDKLDNDKLLEHGKWSESFAIEIYENQYIEILKKSFYFTMNLLHMAISINNRK